MFHMLTSFHLKPGVTMEDFRTALERLSSHMKSVGLLERTGPIGERHSDTPMDTDCERDHRYFFIMSFRDRGQCDRAYDYLKPHEEPGESIHRAVYSKAADPIFTCWQDVWTVESGQ